jgi:hypothetical protein
MIHGYPNPRHKRSGDARCPLSGARSSPFESFKGFSIHTYQASPTRAMTLAGVLRKQQVARRAACVLKWNRSSFPAAGHGPSLVRSEQRHRSRQRCTTTRTFGSQRRRPPPRDGSVSPRLQPTAAGGGSNPYEPALAGRGSTPCSSEKWSTPPRTRSTSMTR